MANVYLVKNKEQRVLGGHPWVFRSDIESVEGARLIKDERTEVVYA